jgi:acetyl-CoA acetyltransferase
MTAVAPADICVVGIGRTDFTLKSGRTTQALGATAVRSAIADAGLTTRDVDGMATFGVNDTALALSVAHAVGIDELTWSLDVFGGGNAVTATIAAAAAAIRGGQCHVAVVYRALNGRSGQRFGEAAEAIGTLNPDAQLGLSVGYALPPQFMAMWARAHQDRYGSTCEDLGRIAITQRAHAVNNPHAIARDPLNMEGYLAGRWINEPLRVFDCAFEVDGAVALVLSSADRAADLPHQPVRISATAGSHGHGGSWDQWPDLTTMFSGRIANRLLQAADIAITDVDVACIYDCFTYTVMAVMEDFGFFPRGDAGEWFAAGHGTYGDTVVVNPHGGLLSEGYIHGLNSHYEAVLQLQRRAGARQVPNPDIALVTGGSGPFGGAAIYEAR